MRAHTQHAEQTRCGRWNVSHLYLTARAVHKAVHVTAPRPTRSGAAGAAESRAE